MLIDEGVVGSGDFGKFEKIEGRPVVNRKEEFEKYVRTEKGESAAAIEMIHWQTFKTRVDKAWAYIHGVRSYSDQIEDETKSYMPLALIISIGLAAVGGVILFIVNLYK